MTIPALPLQAVRLLQARPITTLFPLPVDAPTTDESSRVYLSFTVQQGTYRPFTPMGISAIRVLASSIAALVGYPPRSTLAGSRFVTEAASRVYFDVTAALRSSFGRALLVQSMDRQRFTRQPYSGNWQTTRGLRSVPYRACRCCAPSPDCSSPLAPSGT